MWGNPKPRVCLCNSRKKAGRPSVQTTAGGRKQSTLMRRQNRDIVKGDNTVELWDVYDESGRKTGAVKESDSPFGKGEYRLCGSLWLVNGRGELLIQKRAAAKRLCPGKWSVTGGTAKSGENSLQACIREVKEEIGLVFEENDLTLFLRSVGDGMIFEDYMVCCDAKVEEMTPQAEEVAQLKWATTEEIRALHARGSFMYMEEELNKVLAHVEQNYLKKQQAGEKAVL